MPIIIEKLTHIYLPGSPFEKKAIQDVSARIEDGEWIGLIGHTGSGKTTLIQHFNGLLTANSGRIIINGYDLSDKNTNKREVRSQVGMVFQYPEYQLFEETVAADISFGPKNMGLSEKQIADRVSWALQMVGLSQEEVGQRSPFELSGGQRRRVAIAGVIAMQPKILVLDEPTAGLDPRGRREILSLVEQLRKEYGTTIVMVSHNMDEVAQYTDRVMVMHQGNLVLFDTPKRVFFQYDRMKEYNIQLPTIAQITRELKSRGIDIEDGMLTEEEIAEQLLRLKGISHA